MRSASRRTGKAAAVRSCKVVCANCRTTFCSTRLPPLYIYVCLRLCLPTVSQRSTCPILGLPSTAILSAITSTTQSVCFLFLIILLRRQLSTSNIDPELQTWPCFLSLFYTAHNDFPSYIITCIMFPLSLRLREHSAHDMPRHPDPASLGSACRPAQRLSLPNCQQGDENLAGIGGTSLWPLFVSCVLHFASFLLLHVCTRA